MATAMTQAQQDAQQAILEILKEHFDGSLLVLFYTIGDDAENHNVSYTGGCTLGIGLAELASRALKESCYPVTEDDDE